MNIHRGLATVLRVRRTHTEIAGVILVAIAVRALLYPHIVIRADLGYWLLDAQYVLQGQRPFVDFLGRSPVFHYVYAAVAAVVGVSVASFRWFLVACWLLAGLGIYDLARQVRGHRAGLLAFALMALSPFTIAYGFYASSQAVGVVFGIASVVVAVRRPTVRGYAIAGLCLGIGFMARQSIVLVGAGLWTWLVWDWWQTREHRAAAARGASAFLGGLVAVAGICLAVALGDVEVAWRIFAIDVLALVWSAGGGGVPLLDLADEAITGQVAQSGAGLLRSALTDLSLVALWAAIVGGSPFALGYLPYLRAAGHRWLRPLDRRLIATVAIVAAAIGLAKAFFGGYVLRYVWVGGAGLVAVGLWGRTRLLTATLARPAVAIPVAASVWIGLGYIIRPNLIATYYWMDAWPFAAPMAGVTLAAWLDDLSAPDWQTLIVGVLVLGLASTSALAPLAPLTSAEQTKRVEVLQTQDIEAIQEDMNARVGSDTILASQPIYPAVSDAQLWRENSRALYLAHAFRGGGPMHGYYAGLTAAMESGTIEWVVHEEANRQLLSYNATARATFKRCYEPVDAGGTYRSLNHTLYKHAGC
jgi:hypothetical protein